MAEWPWHVSAYPYTVWRLLGRDVLFCFLPEVPVNNWAAQELVYQPNGQWKISKKQNIMTDQTPHRCLDGAKNPALNLQFVSFGRGNIGSQKRENEMLGDKSILPNCVDKRTKQLVQCIVFFS